MLKEKATRDNTESINFAKIEDAYHILLQTTGLIMKPHLFLQVLLYARLHYPPVAGGTFLDCELILWGIDISNFLNLSQSLKQKVESKSKEQLE